MDEGKKKKLDLQEIRKRLQGETGPGYWKSLEQVADTPEFHQWVDDEFPHRGSLLEIDRRTLLKFMGASMALAGLSGCRSMVMDKAKVVPYVQSPEDVVPGRRLKFRTAMPRTGYALGLEVDSYEGRPIKIEGNPDHPASLGSSDSFAQAALLTMYDPDRSRNVMIGNEGHWEIDTWEGFTEAVQAAIRKGGAGGAGFRVLSETVVSPTLARQVAQMQRTFPNMVWHQWEPLNRDTVYEGARLAFGRPLHTIYDLSKAQVILSVDADFVISQMPGSIRYARQMADGRRVEKTNDRMNRVYSVSTAPTLNGVIADHTEPMTVRQIEELLKGLLGAGGDAFASAVRADLQAHSGACAVVAGEHLPASIHALVHAANAAFGAVGATVQYVEPIEAFPESQAASLKRLVADIKAGEVRTLLILGSNPVYNAPADIGFTADLLNSVKLATFHHGMYLDETGVNCKWHAPEAHFLESWSDARAFDGTASIIQPLTMPILQGRSVHEVLAHIMGKPQLALDIVRETWKGQLPTEKAWRRAVHDGIVPNSRRQPVAVSYSPTQAVVGPREGFEIHFRPDPTIGDGRWANNGWLQELPKPLSKITWDNAVYVSPKTAEQLDLHNADYVDVTANGKTVRAPVWIQPGHADGSATVHLGYGRTHAGRVALGDQDVPRGYNAYAIQSSENPWVASGSIKKAEAAGFHFAVTQDHHSMEGRDIVRSGTLDEYRSNPSLGGHAHEEVTLYNKTEEWTKENPDLPQWGMSIDLNTCIGCNACVTACQAENNIPVVGKEQVARGREMHWIRIDRYYGPRHGKQSIDNPATFFQPMTCQHCETAPCEPVCPVGATVHSHEGLNQMVYNRCVGTRYCSNNCPYKVRRFNFLNYQFNQKNYNKEGDIPLLRMLNSPDVTVRSRGVMEKCTYCVQRINAKRIEAKKAKTDLRDIEMETACSQACPTRAIVFGNIAKADTEVAKLRANHRRYSVLGDLNTYPRTTYLGKLSNPNPALEGGEAH